MPRRPAGSPTLRDQQGYDKLTLSAVASELNVKPPSLYNHMDSLDALRARLAELACRELRHKCTLATEGRSPGHGA